MTETPFAVPVLPPPGQARIDVAAAFDGLRALSAACTAVSEVVDGVVGVLVPAVADECVVEMAAVPSAPAPPSAPSAGTRPGPRANGHGRPGETPAGSGAPTATVLLRDAHEVRVSFYASVNTGFRGTVRCRWTDGYAPSEGDAVLVQAVVDQCVLLADRVHLAEGLQQLQAHTGQLRTAVESNRRIGAAIGVLMVRYGLTEERAFDALRRTSNTSNRKLRDVADDVMYTGSLPEVGRPAQSAQSAQSSATHRAR